MTTSFHAVVCSGTASDFRVEANGSRCDTIRGAVERIVSHFDAIRDEKPNADLFIQVFRTEGGRTVPVSIETGDAVETA